ncbi:ssb2 [Bifidobacterium minimum]|uniref:Single-stranded DNA-binding protein n=1 Tax=Bifidobacterium minimum TaxID=1693 RepID=A0A087BLD1_9BIFI|nr:ssb2 [Bifidobacterium minimum]
MAGETIITVVGNLTADPEVRTIGSGATVTSFTVASTPRSFNRETNQWEDGQALFLRCSAWRALGDHVAQSLSKGMRVIVTGRLSQHSYQAQDGSQRTSIDLTVDEIGPSLRYATAQVTRQSSASGFSGAGRSGGFSAPAGNAGGYQGGAGYNRAASAAPASAPAQRSLRPPPPRIPGPRRRRRTTGSRHSEAAATSAGRETIRNSDALPNALPDPSASHRRLGH